MINLETAWKVYLVLDKYLPASIPETETDVDYFIKIVDNIRKNDGYTTIIYIISIISGISINDLVQMTGHELLELFMIEIRENKVMEMKLFFDRFRGK